MCARAIRLQPFIDEWLNKEVANQPGTRNPDTTTDQSAEVDFRNLKRLNLSFPEWQDL
jgi:hypothetical protein